VASNPQYVRRTALELRLLHAYVVKNTLKGRLNSTILDPLPSENTKISIKFSHS